MAQKKYLDYPGLSAYDELIKDYIDEHGVEGSQSDWTESDSSKQSYIKNKPTLGTVADKNIASTIDTSNDIPTANQVKTFVENKGYITEYTETDPTVPSWAKQSTKPTYTASEVGAIASSLKGSNNGVAELDANGKVPSSQLPSFVDDVIEGYLYNGKFYKESTHATEISGESGKIYVDLSTNKTYRWSGTAFVVISDTIALGETSSTAYRGDRGKVAYDHSQSTHARTDATKTEASSTNGNIKINGTETTVYTHPGSGTNPHGTTKSDVGLGNVGNFKAVSTVASQGLTDTEKSNARANIGAGTSSFSGSYNDLSNKPTIPTVNNGTLTIQKNGTNVQTFTANQSSNATANITVPTKVSELTNDSGYTTNAGTVTQVKVGSTAYNPSSGVISLPAYPTSLPASDVYAWAKASTKPTYTASEVGAAASSHTHNYAGSSSAGGNANALAGTYSGSGGALTPSAVSGGQVKAAMMNNPKGLSLFPTYADCILMDTYTGNDVPWTTGLGIIKQDASPRMFIFNGAKGNTTTWKNITEVVTAGNFTSQSLTKSQVTTALGYTPPTSDTNTHRPIQMNGTEILGNNTTALNLKAGTNVSLSNSSGTVTISATDTNTDTKVTSVGNHYTPSEDTSAVLSADASSTTAATWNSTSLVTGVDIKRDAKGHVVGVAVDSIKMPANPNTNTDTLVTQTATSTNANYEVLFSATADNTTRTETARKYSNFKFNPSTGNLQVTQLNGVTIGSSPKFTDTNTWTKVSTTADGYITKLPGDTSKYFRGDGSWATLTAIAEVISSTEPSGQSVNSYWMQPY